MRIVYFLFLLTIILISLSFSALSYPIGLDNTDKIVYHNGMKSYIIGDNEKAKLLALQKRSSDFRVRQFSYDEYEGETERCIKKTTRNWKRTYYKESFTKEYDKGGNLINEESWWEKDRIVFGFDEEEDSMLKLELRERLKKGEKVC